MSLGLEVMRMMLEEDVEQYAGPKGKHNKNERIGYRHGTEKTTVVMGGKKVRVDRPRARAVDGSSELPLETLHLFQTEDPLNKAIMHGKMTILAAMGIDDDGKKRILGIAEGGSENSTVVKALLEDLIHVYDPSLQGIRV